jgi:hypothetical protein
MRISLKLLAVIWAAVSTFAAFCAAAQFWVTWAVPSDRPYERAIEDVALMYRVTGTLAPASYIAAALLAINAFLIVVLVWTRPRT